MADGTLAPPAASVADDLGPLHGREVRPFDPQAFFLGARDAFERAHARYGSLASHYLIAGHGLTVRCAGGALSSSLLPALAHLACDRLGVEGDADGLTICVWEGSSADVVPPPPDWRSDAYRGNTELVEFADGPVRAAFDSYLGMLSLLDLERRVALFWLRDARHVPITLVGTPFRIILQWWADRHDAQLVHAAAVGTHDCAVVISGPSGVGKSTTALTALDSDSGLLYLGDDFVLVRPEPSPTVYSLYCSAKLDDATLAVRFPALRASLHQRPRLAHEKQVLFVPERWPDRTAADLPLRAILMPTFERIGNARLVRVGAGDALRSLLPGVVAFPGQRRDAVNRIARLTRRVPAYRFELGRNGDDNARVLRDLLRTLSAPPGDVARR